MRKAQGSLEYLIIIAAILAIAAIVVLFLSSALQSEEHASYIGKCKQAASKCAVELSTSAGSLCSYCYDSCVNKDQTEIFPGAYNFCLRGQADMIYEGAVDTIEPTIGSINVIIGSTNVIISWKTDEPADSAVFYSTSVESIATGTPAPEELYNSDLSFAHLITIEGLSPGTTYFYMIRSVDGSGNEGFAKPYSIDEFETLLG